MPIYAYKCAACEHRFDALQKISDAPLTVCPSCGAPALAKQLTAAGFQLKGSGWYATDFKDGGAKGAPAAEKSAEKAADKSAEPPAEKAADKAGAKSAQQAAAAAPAKPADAASAPSKDSPSSAATAGN